MPCVRSSGHPVPPGLVWFPFWECAGGGGACPLTGSTVTIVNSAARAIINLRVFFISMLILIVKYFSNVHIVIFD
jgi:hypothetical protein